MNLPFGDNRQVIAGTVVRFYTELPFTDVTGLAGDPSEVIFAYSVGGGTVNKSTYIGGTLTGLSIVRDGTGLYHVDVDTTGLSGLWVATFIGISYTGTTQTRDEIKLLVKDPDIVVPI